MKNPTPKFIVPVLVLLAACQQPAPVQDCPSQPLTDLFMSEIAFQNPELSFRKISEVTYLEGSAANITDQIVAPVLEKLLRNELKAIDPLWDLDQHIEAVWLTPEDILRKLVSKEQDTLKAEEVLYLRPYEKWFLTDDFKLSRKILGLTFVQHNIDAAAGEIRGTEPMFQLENKPEGEAKKVATISYRQSINKARDGWEWFQHNLEGSVKSKFFGGLLKEVKDGQITVFKTSNLKEALGPNDMKILKSSIDTVYIEDAEPPYDLRMHILKRRTSRSDIVAIDLVQEISVYPNGSISIDTKTYAPVVSSKELKTGEEFLQSALFWVKNE